MALHAHRMVAEAAVEIANELFEDYARVNSLYRQFRANGGTEKQARTLFVARVAPRMFEKAREALALYLAGDYPEALKQQVLEALVMDSALRANRTVSETIGTVPDTWH